MASKKIVEETAPEEYAVICYSDGSANPKFKSYYFLMSHTDNT